MGFYRGPNAITSVLVLSLDAGNTKSYPGTGTTWFDKSGYGTNGTLTNGPTFSSANGGVIVLDGVNDRVNNTVNLTQINNITNSSPFTFSSTLRLLAMPVVSAATVGGILMKGSYNPSYGLNIIFSGDSGGVRTTARIYYGLRNLTGTAGVTPGYGQIAESSNSSLTVGQWYKVDMVHEFAGTTHTLRLYINGVLDKQTTSTNALYPINFQNTAAMSISNQILGGNELSLNIEISNTQIYNIALTAQEIFQNFNATKSRFNL
jgi:hypothetical protein